MIVNAMRTTQYAIQYLTGRPADYLLLYLDSIPDTRYSMLVFIKIGNTKYSIFIKVFGLFFGLKNEQMEHWNTGKL